MKHNIKRIVWIVGTLEQVGGGERLLLEGVKHYRDLGIDVHVVTWKFNECALFDGLYDNKNIIVLSGDSKVSRKYIAKRGRDRFKSFFKLRATLKYLKPDLIICQNEYDCAFLYLANIGLQIPYITLIFGQTYQFPFDLAKYTLIFKKHFNAIRLSTVGYRETIPVKPPSTELINRLMIEIICVIRYYAVRKSKVVFTFSKQVQWEVKKMYKKSTYILKGAYKKAILDFIADKTQLDQYKQNADQKIFLAVSRLVAKKRIDLAISAFSQLLKSKNINTKLLIGGTGPELPKLQGLCKKLGIEAYVQFIGYVPEKQLLHLTSECDVFLSLDIADFDISPYTALALHKPVIWSNEMDTDDFLKSYPFVFAVEPNVDSVANAMNQALLINVQNKSLQYKNNLLKYSWEEYFDKILELSTSK